MVRKSRCAVSVWLVVFGAACGADSHSGVVGIYEPQVVPAPAAPQDPRPGLGGSTASDADEGREMASDGTPPPNATPTPQVDQRGQASVSRAPAPPPPHAWTSFNYDRANSRSNPSERELSPTTVSELSVRWTLETNPSQLDGITGTPAVADGVVYFCDQRAFHARDVETGEEIWTARVDDEAWRCSSPLIRGELVYFARHASLHALRRQDGTTVWSQLLDAHPETLIDSSPVLASERIVIGIASYEMIGEKNDYTFRGSVVALDPDTGAEAWRFYTVPDDPASGAGVGVWSSAAVDEARGLVFIGTGQNYESPASHLGDALLALDSAAGFLVWSNQFHAGDVYNDAGCPAVGPMESCREWAIGAAPNLFVAGNRDVVGVGSKGGVYRVLDRATGEVVWESVLGDGSALGGVMAVAAVGPELIYVSQNTRSSSTVIALDKQTGQSVWRAPMTYFTWGALTVANGVLYLPATPSGRAVALDATTGSELWSADLGHDAAGGFSVVDGTLFAPSGFSGMGAVMRPGAQLTVFGLP
jgi:polyvinyl alcohol dehydrogenase (cytochrome)